MSGRVVERTLPRETFRGISQSSELRLFPLNSQLSRVRLSPLVVLLAPVSFLHVKG